jgi:8-oxo-dGTP pyrophosphatase MutT (NUDIX family)
MKPPKQKVLAYITRAKPNGPELLVFKHRDFPEAGIQVPAGTVNKSENLIDALKREIKEESGIELKSGSLFLGSFDFIRPDTQERQIRNVYHCPIGNDLPDSWDHSVSGHGEDEHMIFQYYWIPITDAKKSLAVNQGDYISKI